jgi:Tfp pilus assembly PilM family ATPase
VATRVVGLDIGVEQVKAVALQKRRHQYTLTGVGLSAIPRRADDRAVAQAVRTALRDAGAGKNAAVCAAVGGPSVVVKGMQLPHMPLTRVMEAVRWSFREHGLLPAGNSIFDVQLLSPSSEGQMHILAVCVPQELVERRRRILALAGVTLQKLDVEPFALLNAILALQGVATDETLVLLNLAPETAWIGVYHAVAGAPLIRYLHDQHESVADMIGEIRTVVAYFQAEHGTQSALRVVYCGPKSTFTELKEPLQELLALWNHHDDPILFDPLSRLEGAARLLPADTSIECSQFAQAVGLAMRAQ